jgi:hypothetical protein
LSQTIGGLLLSFFHDAHKKYFHKSTDKQENNNKPP